LIKQIGAPDQYFGPTGMMTHGDQGGFARNDCNCVFHVTDRMFSHTAVFGNPDAESQNFPENYEVIYQRLTTINSRQRRW
jgi:hypothetical protein